MRRTKILAATFVASTAIAVPALASPAQAQVPGLTPSDCGLLCGLVEEIEGLLEPLAPVTDPLLDPLLDPVLDPLVEEVVEPVVKTVDPVLEPVLGPVLNPSSPNNPLAPLLPEPAPAPAPAPGAGGGEGPAAPGDTQAVSSGTPAPYSTPIAPTTLSAMEQLRAGPSIPSVPAGSSLNLSPFQIPALSMVSDLGVPSLDDDLSLPAAADSPFQPVIEAVTASASSSSDGSATAAIFAIVMLAVATGLLVDQARRPAPARR